MRHTSSKERLFLASLAIGAVILAWLLGGAWAAAGAVIGISIGTFITAR